ncbi:hypothetical protein T09_15606 [Trichinella sp. T9]|nr:hypothetical protein T09_15606 [Trichinella sp. T9]
MPEAGRSILCVKVLVRFSGHVPTVTSRRVRPLDLLPRLRQFLRRYYSSLTRLRFRGLFFVSPSSALVSSLPLHYALVHLISLGWSPPLQYIEIFRRRGAPGGLLRGGFDPLPRRTISEWR